jgi:hypothetical protein
VYHFSPPYNLPQRLVEGISPDVYTPRFSRDSELQGKDLYNGLNKSLTVDFVLVQKRVSAWGPPRVLREPEGWLDLLQWGPRKEGWIATEDPHFPILCRTLCHNPG